MYRDPVERVYDEFQEQLLDLYLKDYYALQKNVFELVQNEDIEGLSNLLKTYNQVISSFKGQCIVGYSGGKSFISQEIIRKCVLIIQYIIDVVNTYNIDVKVNPFIGCIVTARLALNDQYLRKIIKSIVHPCATKKIGIVPILVGSDPASIACQSIVERLIMRVTDHKIEIINTTYADELKQIVEMHRRLGLHSIIISTYHSSHTVLRLTSDDNFILDYFNPDECHNAVPKSEGERGLPAKNEHKKAIEIRAKKMMATTATWVGLGNPTGPGMDNVERWGEIVCSVSQVELQRLGITVPLEMSVVGVDEGILDANVDCAKELESLSSENDLKDKDMSSRVDMIGSVFRYQYDRSHSNNKHGNIFGHILLCVSRGSGEQFRIASSKRMKELIQELEIKYDRKCHCGSIDSTDGIWMDGKHFPYTSKNKQIFMNWLKSIPVEDNTLILHNRIIGEGIDIDTFTGVFFMRHCGLVWFIQNIGRILRLLGFDFDRIKNGTLEKCDYENYAKALGQVTFQYAGEYKDETIGKDIKRFMELAYDPGHCPKEIYNIIRIKPKSKVVIPPRDGGLIDDTIPIEFFTKGYDRKMTVEEFKERKIVQKEKDKLQKWIKNGEWDKIQAYRNI